jgi:hypothetical protein
LRTIAGLRVAASDCSPDAAVGGRPCTPARQRSKARVWAFDPCFQEFSALVCASARLRAVPVAAVPQRVGGQKSACAFLERAGSDIFDRALRAVARGALFDRL